MKTNTLEFDAQALREKILDLAMRGKLVPQDPNDEPASVLLKKIKAEKEKLIKEKKIKKSKPLAPISDNEKPFDIPDSWEWVRLGDAANFIGTGMVVPSSQQYKDLEDETMIPYFKMNNIGNWNGEFDLTNIVYIKKNEKVDKYLISSDELLFNTRNSRELVGKTTVVPTINKRIVANNNILRITTFGNIQTKFLNYILISPYGKNLFFNLTTATTNVAAIYQKQLREIMIPLPPLEEQSRIAAKIAQLFALLRKVESSTQQYAKLQTLLKSKVLDLAMRGKLVEQDPHDEPASLLLEKIKAEKEQLVKEGKIKKSKPLPPITDDEKLFNLPQGWTWVKLNDVLALENGAIRRGPFGSSLKKSFFVPKSEDTYKVYEQGNAINHTINYGSYYISYQKYEELQSFSIRPGDIIISGAGTIGKTYILPSNSPKGVINQALIRVRLNEQLISKEYFLFAFKQKVGLINKQAKGTAIKNMFSVTHMKNDLVWALPPLAEQKRITKKIQNILSFVK